jgi:hypothetical protein
MGAMRFIDWKLCIVLLSTSVFAQKKITTQSVNESIVYATVDRPGDLYIVTSSGQIQKFDKDGKVASVYKNNPSPTLFDPRDGSRLFAYFRDDQHFSFLNPSFDVTSSSKLDPAVAIDPWLMCVSGDYNFWVLDAADISLKKINAATGTVTIDAKISQQPGDSVSSYVYIREYQGFVFLLHKKNGVLIFSGLGKPLKVVGESALTHFNFLGEELYFQTDNTINFFNLFTAETREMHLKQTGQFVLLTDERLFIIQNNSIDFFEISP